MLYAFSDQNRYLLCFALFLSRENNKYKEEVRAMKLIGKAALIKATEIIYCKLKLLARSSINIATKANTKKEKPIRAVTETKASF